jgi:hypothetical protein
MKKIGDKGQAAWFDIVIILLSIAIFTAGIWAFTINGKAAGTQEQRSRQDFTNSLLIGMFYTTLDGEDPKYRGKSISDVICMYFSAYDEDEEKVSKDFVIESLKYARIHEYIKAKGYNEDGHIEWQLTAEYDGFFKKDDSRLCLRGEGEGIGECSGEKTVSYEVTSAVTELSCPKNNVYRKTSVHLAIIWK